MAEKLSVDTKLRRNIRRTIESRKNYLDKPDRKEYRKIVFQFLEMFFLCEIGTKTALNAYYQHIGEEKEITDINMSMNDITKALSFAGFIIPDSNLKGMFKKNNKRGEKSARDLRNSIVHSLSDKDIQELVDRWEDIESLLSSYLSYMESEPLK